MSTVDGVSNNRSIPIINLLKQKNTEFVNSIFSQTVGDNELIEASDFKNYKAGQNSYIDNLIKSGKTWTEDLINKVTDSFRISNKNDNAKITNAPVKITIGDGNIEVTDDALDKLERLNDSTNEDLKTSVANLKKLLTVDYDFNPDEIVKSIDDILKLISVEVPEKKELFSLRQNMIQLKEEKQSLSEQRDQLVIAVRAAQTEEEKEQIRSTLARDYSTKLEAHKQKKEALVASIDTAIGKLEKLENKDAAIKEAAGLESVYDPSEERYIESVKCTLTFTDENGQPKDMNLHIRLDLIEDFRNRTYRGSHEISYSKVVKQILAEFKTEIDKLPQQVKDDLYNEVADIQLTERNSRGKLGFYNEVNSTIELPLKAEGTNGLYEIDKSVQALVHEIGHAIDEKGSEDATDALKEKFNEYTKLLVKKGIIPSSYRQPEYTRGYYSLTSVDEFFAEVIYAGQNGKESDFTGTNKALASQDLEVQTKLKELLDLGNQIIAERRSFSRDERIGVKKNNLSDVVYKNPEITEAYYNVVYGIEDNELYKKYGNNLQNLFEAYYAAKSNPNDNSEGVQLINNLQEKNPNDWSKIAGIFDKHLKNNGLI